MSTLVNSPPDGCSYESRADTALPAQVVLIGGLNPQSRTPSHNRLRVRLTRWIRAYDCHRHHTASYGSPASRARNLTRLDT